MVEPRVHVIGRGRQDRKQQHLGQLVCSWPLSLWAPDIKDHGPVADVKRGLLALCLLQALHCPQFLDAWGCVPQQASTPHKELFVGTDSVPHIMGVKLVPIFSCLC